MTPNKEATPYTCKGCNGKVDVSDAQFAGRFKQDAYCIDCIDVIWQPDQPQTEER